MKRSILPFTVLALCVAFCGCKALELEKRESDATKAYRTIINWLECEECTDAELRAVVQLGDRAVPSLVASLNQGPSQASRELLRNHLVTTYRELREYGQTHPEAKVPVSEKDYVNTYMDNYIALYQARAATALAAIGGPMAENAMKKALDGPMRDDVRITVQNSLRQLNKR